MSGPIEGTLLFLARDWHVLRYEDARGKMWYCYPKRKCARYEDDVCVRIDGKLPPVRVTEVITGDERGPRSSRVIFKTHADKLRLLDNALAECECNVFDGVEHTLVAGPPSERPHYDSD